MSILGKITWNNINYGYSTVHLDDTDMYHANNNLKEITMDGLGFYNYYDAFSDLNNNQDSLIFCKCSKGLQRVSIQNGTQASTKLPIPQDALIKFVRNVPTTLKWF